MSLFAPALLGAQAPSGDWTQWRGPGRDGVIPSFTAPAKWPEQLTLRWKAEVGTGHATPILVGTRVYMFSRRGDNEVLAAFDASTGKRLWHKPAPPAGPTYTTSQSPLFDNGQLIVHVGGYGKGALTSFNPATGDINWEWNGDGPAYGSPIVAEFGGTRQVITFTENMLVGVAAATGELLWSRPFHSARDVLFVVPIPLIAAAFCACYVPAHKAARVDPNVALRHI